MYQIKIIESQIPLEEVKQMSEAQFGYMIKAVADIEKNYVAIGGELHADAESLLLKNGSSNNNLWGINIYPEGEGNDFVEFDSMINIRPGQKNFSRYVEDETIREKIISLVNKLIKR